MLNHGRKKLKMKNEKLKMIGKLFLTLFTIHYSLFTLLSAASVEATVDTQEVVKGNPVQLNIKAVGKAVAFPRINQINGMNVTSTGTSKSSSMSITSSGMVSETYTVKKYVFVPDRDMTIPAYTVNISGKKYKTKPIEIKVVQSQAPTVQKNAKFSFVLKSDKKSVYVGETFVMTLYISVSNDLRGVQIGNFVEPTSNDFFIKAIDGQKEYQTKDASVIEKQYIVTAKKEGNFTIGSASAKLGQVDRSRQDIFGRYGIRWSNIVSNTLDIEVKVQEKESDLVGDFSLDAKIDSQKVKANKPVNLTIKIEGKGNLEDFEFPKYEIDGVTIYSDKAKVQSHLAGTAFVSTYTKSFAFIAEEDFTIPKRSISVYNPNTKETKVLEVASYHVNVEGKKVSTKQATSNSTENKETQADKIKEINVEKKIELKSVVPWWMLVLAFVLGMLTLYLLQVLPRLWQRKERNYKDSDALKILYSHISEDKAVEEMVRKLYAKKSGDKSVQIDKKELKEMLERFRG